MRKQAGFTIIELVVVIALLGILAAVALPRFINVTEDAHKAAVQGAAGALASAVSLVKAQAIVNNAQPGDAVLIDGGSVNVNANRFPISTDGSVTVNVANCTAVWGAILQAGAPSVPGDYTPTVSGSSCVYTYTADTNAAGDSRTISYDTSNGEVATADL